jgi:hypothetical protein
MLTARVPDDLINRLDAKARELQITRGMLVRTVLETLVSTPDELRERIRRESAIRKWIRNGCDPDKDPEKEWNDDA